LKRARPKSARLKARRVAAIPPRPPAIGDGIVGAMPTGISPGKAGRRSLPAGSVAGRKADDTNRRPEAPQPADTGSRQRERERTRRKKKEERRLGAGTMAGWRRRFKYRKGACPRSAQSFRRYRGNRCVTLHLAEGAGIRVRVMIVGTCPAPGRTSHPLVQTAGAAFDFQAGELIAFRAPIVRQAKRPFCLVVAGLRPQDSPAPAGGSAGPAHR